MQSIVIIDDEKLITQTLSTLIEMMLDIKVYAFNDVDALFQTDFLDTVKIDLVISDFMMPKLNGIEVLKRIKEKQPKIIPILLTGYSDKDNAIKSINEVGLYYYVEKPWDNQELITIIRNGLDKKDLQDAVTENMIVIEKRNEEITRLYDLLRRDFNNEMGNLLSVVVSFANLIEAKDDYTDDHTRRVAELAVALGALMDVSTEDLKNIEISAMIHDIGKVGTPDQILNKPSGLTPFEFDIMKDHPVLGANILRPLSVLEPCLDVVMHHHEKLDGSGYPDGLKGEAISIHARIVAIADIFDALYSDRPYRSKMPIAKAMSIIEGDVMAGKLDQKVYEALCTLQQNGRLAAIYGHLI